MLLVPAPHMVPVHIGVQHIPLKQVLPPLQPHVPPHPSVLAPQLTLLHAGVQHIPLKHFCPAPQPHVPPHMLLVPAPHMVPLH
jgi:hypothetical protein